MKLEMKKYNTILTEKEQKYWNYHQGKTDKYEYLTGQKILPSDHSRVTEQTKFTYYLLGKAFEKQIKTVENHDENLTKTINDNK